MTGRQASTIEMRDQVGVDAPGPTVDALGVLRHRGAWISLSPTHEAIMRALIDRLGEAVTRGEVAAAAWPGGGPDLHAIDVHVHRLRPRLARIGLVIHTLRGRGYMLETLTGDSATRRR